MISFGSVCSGIESASVALEPLGFKADWFAEIDLFPSEVLKHHWPDTPNLGGMTRLAEAVRCGLVPAPRMLIGGTPCQSYSVAGKRRGLDDPRGQLTLAYVDLLDAIDARRPGDEAVCLWENVPGVLHDAGNAFGEFLGRLAGETEPLQPGACPPAGKSTARQRWDKKRGVHVPKWTNAGCVFGPKRTVAWRVVDAQYFGVAQRRRRVFLVASARKRFDPTEVLFEFGGVRRDSAPSGETRPQDPTNVGGGFGLRGAGWWGEGVGPFRARDNGYEQLTVSTLLAQGNSTGGDRPPGTTVDTIGTLQVVHGIPGNWIGRKPENGGNATQPHFGVSPCLTGTDLHGVQYGTVVRRLMPVECERLQGFQDGHTLIPWRGGLAPDGLRYKAIGNSKAVPCVRWIGKRLMRQLCGT
jgi:site-specific DNA-cytosine methylase